MDTKQLINLLFEITVKNKNNDLPQEADNKTALKCWYILAMMKIKNEEDMIFYLICMSLINAYIKQDENTIIHIKKNDYFFKEGCLFVLFDYVIKHRCEYVKISYNPKEKWDDNVVFFDFNHFQFSFHGIGLKDKILQIIPTKYFNNQVFNEIQNKKSSIELYEAFLKNSTHFSNLDRNGLNLMQSASNFVDQYEKSSAEDQQKMLDETIFKKIRKYIFGCGALVKYHSWKNRYEKNIWEIFGASGTNEQVKIFSYYLRFLNKNKHVGELKDYVFTISLEWEKQNPRQFANILRMIYDNGGTYSQDASQCNIFVRIDLRDDKWRQVDCPRLKIVNDEISNGKQIQIIKLDDLFDKLNTNQLDLIKLDYPSGNWLFEMKDEIKEDKAKEQLEQLNNEIKGSNNPFDKVSELLFGKKKK